jgi:hypothetical protein
MKKQVNLAQNLLHALLEQSLRVNKIYGAAAIKLHIQNRKRNYSADGSISQLNRHTNKPHEHKREIARYQRQNEA